jgi:hypothetical protein
MSNSYHPIKIDSVGGYTLNLEEYTITAARYPQPAGYWVIDPTPGFQTKFAVKKRPTEEHIRNHEALLGWIWEDYK